MKFDANCSLQSDIIICGNPCLVMKWPQISLAVPAAVIIEYVGINIPLLLSRSMITSIMSKLLDMRRRPMKSIETISQGLVGIRFRCNCVDGGCLMILFH